MRAARHKNGKLKHAPPSSCMPWVGHALACPDHQELRPFRFYAARQPEGRKKVAHGASHGLPSEANKPRRGGRSLLTPLTGLGRFCFIPTAYAVGYFLSPYGLGPA